MLLSEIEKIKAGRRIGSGERQDLNWFREGFSMDVTFEQRPDGG